MQSENEPSFRDSKIVHMCTRSPFNVDVLKEHGVEVGDLHQNRLVRLCIVLYYSSEGECDFSSSVTFGAANRAGKTLKT